MADNVILNNGTGGSTLATKDITHGGDAAQLQTVSLQGVSGSEGSYTTADINGDATNGLDVDVTRLPALVAGTAAIGKLAANSGVDIGDVDVTSVIPGTAATSLGKAEDAVHTSGDTGVMSLAVRNDVLAALAGADGDYAPLQVNATGALFVEAAGTVTANLSATDNAVLDTIDAVLDTINAKLASGTVIGDVNLGATDNAVLDNIQTAVQLIDDAISGTEMQVDVVAALPAGTNAIGKLAANSGVVIGDVNLGATDNAVLDSIAANQLPATSGGISSVYRDEDIDEVAVALKASAGQIYWIHCINLDATPVYLHFYNVAQGSVTVGTTGEVCSFAVPSQGDANGAGFTMHFNHGIAFSTAITVACTTTIGGTAGPAANEVILNVGYA